MAAPYLAPSLVKLRNEINAKWPRRDRGSDGWVGDKAHRARKSQHNPDGKGCVHAIDVDKDGIDVKALLREVIGDGRVWYVIWNRVMYSRSYGWRARRYTGSNPHDKHVHISIRLDREAETNGSPWFGQPRASRAAVRGQVAPTRPPTAGAPTTRPARPGQRTIQRGSRGADVSFLQRWLGIEDDGIFGPNTEQAVKRYQRMRGIRVDGIVGEQTWGHLLGKRG